MIRLFGLGRDPGTFEFKCPDCGKIHRGSPSFAYAKPAYYFDVPKEERGSRVALSDDLCCISPGESDDDRTIHYFIRCLLEIPIRDADEPFLWGVWVTQSEESFERYKNTFETDQSGMGSFGWLAVVMPPYRRNAPGEPHEHLKCNVQWQGTKNGKGQRPLIEIQECDHPLYADQRDGISWDRAIKIARAVMHG